MPTAPNERPKAVVRCPAKVNLHLRVGPARADGFHPLRTWMCAVGLFDTLTFEPAGDGAADAIRLACDDPSLPTDERNLVVRIVRGWADHLAAAGRTVTPLSATLAKRIPAGAGLGGGSSDAAFALGAVDRFWTGGLTPTAELSAFAARFGSDISFFLHGPSGSCSGRGEVVRPVPPPAVARWAVLLLPPVHVPTPDVYRRFDAMGLGRDADVSAEPDWPAWAKLPAAELMPRLVNDLEPPAYDLRPSLAELRRSAEHVLGRTVRMSGSGSSHFALSDARDEADAAAAKLAAAAGFDGVRLEVVEVAPDRRPG